MAVKTKNRVLRPSTRKSTSPYRINLDDVNIGDELIVNITHESNLDDILFSYRFSGDSLRSKNSIHFKANRVNNNWVITWSGCQPLI